MDSTWLNTSECCPCCILQPNIDWNVGEYTMDKSMRQMKAWFEEKKHVLFVKEDASFLMRAFSFVFPGGRETKYTVHKGNKSTHLAFTRHEKWCTFGVKQLLGCIPTKEGPICIEAPCCCNLPYLETYDAVTDRKFCTSRVLCDCKPLIMPKFGVFDENDDPVYRIQQPDLCCFDCCIEIRKSDGLSSTFGQVLLKSAVRSRMCTASNFPKIPLML